MSEERGVSAAVAQGQSEGHRSRRRLDPATRREAILTAAGEAFARAPYDRVSLVDVAAAAGVSEALVHKYFDGKAGLYAEVTRAAIEALEQRQRTALAALPPNTSARDQVRVSIIEYLDLIAAQPAGWTVPLLGGASDPEAARQVRLEAREGYIEALGELLPRGEERRRRQALVGHFGFLEAVCRAWVASGCPADDREPLITAALGALEGALGDWG